jgi:hypothetical protein
VNEGILSMSPELRHDLPVLAFIVTIALIFPGAPLLIEWSERRRFDMRVRIAAAITAALFLSVAGLIDLIQLPGSENFAVYLGIVGGGAVYALGCHVQNRITRAMAWNGWPKTYALRYGLRRYLIPFPFNVAWVAAGFAIYFAVK